MNRRSPFCRRVSWPVPRKVRLSYRRAPWWWRRGWSRQLLQCSYHRRRIRPKRGRTARHHAPWWWQSSTRLNFELFSINWNSLRTKIQNLNYPDTYVVGNGARQQRPFCMDGPSRRSAWWPNHLQSSARPRLWHHRGSRRPWHHPGDLLQVNCCSFIMLIWSFLEWSIISKTSY